MWPRTDALLSRLCSELGIWSKGPGKLNVVNCQFKGSADGGLYCGRFVSATIEKCHFEDCAGSGSIDLHKQARVTVRDVTIVNHRGLCGVFASHTEDSTAGSSDASLSDDGNNMQVDASDEEDDGDDALNDDEDEDDDINLIQGVAEGMDHVMENAEEQIADKMLVDSLESTPAEGEEGESNSEEGRKGFLDLERVSISGCKWNAVIITGAMVCRRFLRRPA